MQPFAAWLDRQTHLGKNGSQQRPDAEKQAAVQAVETVRRAGRFRADVRHKLSKERGGRRRPEAAETRGRDVQWVWPLCCRRKPRRGAWAGCCGQWSLCSFEMKGLGDCLRKGHTMEEVNESTHLDCTQRFSTK